MSISDGSRPLENARHEMFAQLLAAGEPAIRAYAAAGYKGKPSSAPNQSARLSKDKKISARVAHLVSLNAAVVQEHTAKAAENAGVDKAWVMSRLKEVAERCLQNVPVLDGRGELVMVETKDGLMAPAYKFDAKGAVGALVPLGKELGLFIERSIVQVSALESAPDEQVDAYLQQAARDLGISLPAAAPRH